MTEHLTDTCVDLNSVSSITNRPVNTDILSLFVSEVVCIVQKPLTCDRTCPEDRRHSVAAGRGPQGCRAFPCSIPECSLSHQEPWNSRRGMKGFFLPHGKGANLWIWRLNSSLLGFHFYVRDRDPVLLYTALTTPGQPPGSLQ